MPNEVIRKNDINENIIKYLEDNGYSIKQRIINPETKFITGKSLHGNFITLRVSMTTGDVYGLFKEGNCDE